MSVDVLSEEVEALKVLLDEKSYEYEDGAEQDVLSSVQEMLNLPPVYVRFLEQLNPGESFWRLGEFFTLQLYSADTLPDFQTDAWHEQQIIIGAMNEVPLALQMDGEKDLDSPIFRLNEEGAMCVASSLPQFLSIVRTGLEMLGRETHYDEEDMMVDDSYDDVNDYDSESFATHGPEAKLQEYLEELEDIDPDCLDAWEASFVGV